MGVCYPRIGVPGHLSRLTMAPLRGHRGCRLFRTGPARRREVGWLDPLPVTEDPPGSGQGRHQDVRIRRGEALQVALIPGQDQPTTRLNRDGDHVCISEMI